MILHIDRALTDEILDLGGGGEGVIGRVYREQVTAIDICPEELDEAPDVCRKLVMDATALAFPGDRFDHVTAFFSLLYMGRFAQQRAIAEAARVLRPGGRLHIWDADVISAEPEPFLIDLDLRLPRESLHTTYGIVKPDAQQDSARFVRLCEGVGLNLLHRQESEGAFYLEFEKLKERNPNENRH